MANKKPETETGKTESKATGAQAANKTTTPRSTPATSLKPETQPPVQTPTVQVKSEQAQIRAELNKLTQNAKSGNKKARLKALVAPYWLSPGSRDVDTLYFCREKAGTLMGYQKVYDARKRQGQVNPDEKVLTMTRKEFEAL